MISLEEAMNSGYDCTGPFYLLERLKGRVWFVEFTQSFERQYFDWDEASHAPSINKCIDYYVSTSKSGYFQVKLELWMGLLIGSLNNILRAFHLAYGAWKSCAESRAAREISEVAWFHHNMSDVLADINALRDRVDDQYRPLDQETSDAIRNYAFKLMTFAQEARDRILIFDEGRVVWEPVNFDD